MPCVFPVLSIKVLSLLDSSQGERKAIRLSAADLHARSAGVVLGPGRRPAWPARGGPKPGLGLSATGAWVRSISGLPAVHTRAQLNRRFRDRRFADESGRRPHAARQVLRLVLYGRAGDGSCDSLHCSADGSRGRFCLEPIAAVCTLVFTVMALGLASPFLLMSLFPQLSRMLPRPGAWMERSSRSWPFRFSQR